MSLETLCVKTEAEEADMCGDEGRARVKEEVECEDRSALCELYAGHQVKDELVLGPVEMHRPCVLSALPGQAPLAYNILTPETNKRQARVQEKEQNPPYTYNATKLATVLSSRRSNGTKINAIHLLLLPMNMDTEEVPPEEPSVNTFTAKTESNATKINIKSESRKHIQKHELMKKSKTLKASKDFTCKKCRCTFETKLLLVEHAKSRHAEVYFNCSKCEYMTCYESKLQRHLRTHTGERPFKCSECRSAFAEGDDLMKHLRTHTGVKPYKCTQCTYAFVRIGSLQRHLRTHTGDKPYKCTQCSYAFVRSGNLQRHLRTHTGDKPYR